MPTFVVKSKWGTVPTKLEPGELKKAPDSLLAEAASLDTEQDIKLDSWPDPNLAAFRVGLSTHAKMLQRAGKPRLCKPRGAAAEF